MRLPIRVRLTAAFAVVLAAVLAAAGVFVVQRVKATATNAIDVELRARARTATSSFEATGRFSRALLGVTDERFGQLIGPDGEVIATSAQLRRRPMAALEAGLRSAVITTKDERRAARLLVVPMGQDTLLLATAVDDRDDALATLRRSLWWAGAVVLGLGTLLSWVLAGAALRPVERLRRAAAGYSASDLTGRLDEPATNDEIRRLALTLNAMLTRIQDSFARQRAFVDHASHELRTPLANLSLELELAQRGERTREEMETALVSAAHEVRRLDALASNLLVLARSTDGRLPIVRGATDLSDVVRATAATFAARAAAQQVDLDVESGATGVVLVDAVRMRQVVTNLLDNALRVSPPGGRVRVEVRVDGDEIRIEVSDTGPGFSDAVSSSAFEMFVRGSDDRSAPGAGLGLAIVAAIADAHGGRARIESDPDATTAPERRSGAAVSVTVPLLRPDRGPSSTSPDLG